MTLTSSEFLEATEAQNYLVLWRLELSVLGGFYVAIEHICAHRDLKRDGTQLC